ncbi:phage tail length tape measure family protein [Stenotrophomonas sp. C3(2023)]|uniref:phage tail length tape measure family protein n=1 Tax=Stenotrophomonas sp. C3(2023) TaxID=3080277 RepID=UPI00293C20E0|nr:phage tail length tape measure family protein [Stenotrophomonas sp. C3(2023)]MDV3469004.1 phage tail length tape measure family protein [Stenotrophomonas sp. C3(2023)]
MDIAELGYKVDSSGLAEGTKALDENAAAADKVSGATDRLERDFQSLSRTVERSSSALGDRLGGALDRIGTGTGAVITELQTLNQTNASILTALGAMEGKLASTASNLQAVGSAASTTAVAQQQLATASQQLDRELASQDARFRSVAQQAVQYAESMRGANVSERALAEAARDAAAGIDVKARAMAAGGTEQQRMVARVKALEEAELRTAQQQKEAARASQAQELNLQKLLGQINPTVAALNRLADQEERLARARDLGLLRPQVWQQYQNQIDLTRARLLEASNGAGKLTGGFGKLNLQAIETQQSLGTLMRALMTGNFAQAQASITSLTARSGALSAMFSATGVTVAGFALGLGALVATTYSAQKQMDAYNGALLKTGNSAGLTASGLSAAAETIGRTTGRYEQARKAVVALVEEGRVSGDMLVRVATTAAGIAEMTGREASVIARQLEAVAREPSKALIELDGNYHFLTAAVLEHTKALEDQGRESEAATFAMTAAMDELDRRTEQAKAQTQALTGVIRSLRTEWQAFTADLRQLANPTLDINIAQIQQKLQSLQNGSFVGPRYLIPGARDRDIAVLQEQLRLLNQQRSEQQELASGEALWNQLREDGVAAYSHISTVLEGARTRAEKLEASTRRLKESYEALRVSNPQSDLLKGVMFGANGSISGGSFDVALAKLAKDAAKGERKTARNSDDSAAQTMLATALRQIEANKQLVETGVKVTESERQAMAIEQALAKGKNTMTASTRALLTAAREELLASGQKAAAYTKEKEAAEALARQQAILAQAGANRDRANELDVMGMGRGSDAVAMLRRQLDIQREYQDELKRLGSRDVAKEKETWDLLAANAASFRDSELAKERAFQETRLAMLGDWRAGVNRVWEDYVFAARNAMDQAGGVMSTALSGWEDAWVRLAQTGKLSFSDMANSIIADLARIGARQASMGLVNAIAGAWGGFGAAAGGAVSSTYSAQSFGNNTGWLNGGLNFGGGRASGGAARLGSFYQVGEGGRPELFEQNGRQYLIPGDSGRVIPAAPGRQASGKAEAARVNVTINNAPAGTSAEASVTQGANGEMNIEVMLKQVDQYIGSNIASGTGATYAGAKARFGLQEAV